MTITNIVERAETGELTRAEMLRQIVISYGTDNFDPEGTGGELILLNTCGRVTNAELVAALREVRGSSLRMERPRRLRR
ncbi:MAG: hypothetical protein JF886_02735 [Candidatus Dormibacteraeota bacterium]|uniref:Uncharacterized protein n=1 Tax=Candidatus Aeolococcus gillhamiae TaxID=3127015 RepID=A0A934JVE6_9BACT|nr:hypothetical protein [Candidatus Dormibacteraeota bacterium]